MGTNANKRRRRTEMDNDFGNDSDSDAEVRSQMEDAWPRYILVKPADDDKPLNGLSPFAVNKAFEGVTPGLSDIKRLRDGSFLVHCKSRRQSELLMKRDGSLFVDRPIKVEVHRTLNSCKGVIHCRDLASSTEGEIKRELASQGVTDVHRCTAKKEGKVVPTNTYFVTFCLPRLPETIRVGYLQVRVTLYIPSPMRCYKCQRFGHTSSKCNSPVDICSKCSKTSHEGSCKPKCANCEGEHTANSRECPRWKLESAIQRVRAERKVSFGEAKKIVQANEPNNTGPSKVIPGKSFSAAAAATPVQKVSSTHTSSLEATLERLVETVNKLSQRVFDLEAKLSTVTGLAGTRSSGTSRVVEASASSAFTKADAKSKDKASASVSHEAEASAPASSAAVPKGTPLAGSQKTPNVTEAKEGGSRPPPSKTSGTSRAASGGGGAGARTPVKPPPPTVRPNLPPKPNLNGAKGKGSNRFDILTDMDTC